MSTNQKTGLLAFGIVGGLGLFAGLAVLVVAISNRDAGANASPAKPTDTPSVDREKDPDAYARSHKWLNRPLTQKELDSILNTIVNTNAGHWVYINRDAKVVVHAETDHSNPFPDLPLSLGTRASVHVTPTITNGARRWTRDVALEYLVSALDSAEFHGGPARR